LLFIEWNIYQSRHYQFFNCCIVIIWLESYIFYLCKEFLTYLSHFNDNWIILILQSNCKKTSQI
jgi:hypothetical protein